jgi:hypothetical protein
LDCEGTALRPLAGDTEPSICICPKHQTPLEDGDHSECPIELLACPEHRDEQLREIGIFDSADLLPSEDEPDSGMFTDQDGKPLSASAYCVTKTIIR